MLKNYLVEEVLQEGLTRTVAAFSRHVYPQARCVLVYGGETRMWPDFVEVIPLKEFLTTLPQVLAEGSAGNTAGR